MQTLHKLNAIVVVLAAVILWLSCPAGLSLASEPQKSDASSDQGATAKLLPKAVFLQTRYQFEPVMEGTEIKHDFVIENHGKGLLEIKEVNSD